MNFIFDYLLIMPFFETAAPFWSFQVRHTPCTTFTAQALQQTPYNLQRVFARIHVRIAPSGTRFEVHILLNSRFYFKKFHFFRQGNRSQNIAYLPPDNCKRSTYHLTRLFLCLSQTRALFNCPASRRSAPGIDPDRHYRPCFLVFNLCHWQAMIILWGWMPLR